MNRRLQLPLAILLGLAVRVPFWVEALRTPVDGDTAIIGLMARHLGQGSTMWGQPYGSPLEAVLVAPFVAALGPTTPALRLPYFLLGLALIPLAYALGRALHPDAALPAALLMAFPPPYFLLMASLPAPLYPATLVLCALLLLLSLKLGERLDAGARPLASLAVAGLLAGLALWTHPVSACVVAACGGFLALRARGRRLLLAAAVPGLLLAGTPLWLDPRGAGAVVVSRREGLVAHALEVLPELPRPVGGLLGTHVPVIPDDARDVVFAPPWAAAALILVYGLSLIQAARASRGRGAPGLLLTVAALGLLVFPLPVRSGAHSIRFLTPVYLAVLALVAWAPAARAGGRRALVVALALGCLHLVGATRLLEAWRGLDRGATPFLLPDLAPARRVLEQQGIRRAYASYGPAYRLTYESGERIVVSPPWNERFRHHPLPYLDEVRFAKNVAWVLTPGIPTDIPAPQAFEAALSAIGGGWKRTEAGAAVVYHGFAPPFGPAIEPVRAGEPVGDADLGTAVFPRPDLPVAFALDAPRALDGLTLVSGYGAIRLPRSMDVEVSPDGMSFETVARRRRRDEREDLRWVNGHPQYVLEHDLLAIPLGGRMVAALRITPYASNEAWALAEVLLHPAADPARGAPWDEWLDPSLSWAERRRALAANPRRDREDWYYRSLLAERHRCRDRAVVAP